LFQPIAPPGQTIQLSDGGSLNIQITKETQTYYDYELELNEGKREIKLLKDEFVLSLEEELREIMQ
jgi:predicted secreted protein